VALIRVGERPARWTMCSKAGRRTAALGGDPPQADEAMRYPAFVLFRSHLCADVLSVVCAAAIRHGAARLSGKLDPIVLFFLDLSELVRSHGDMFAGGFAVLLTAGWLLGRRADVQRAIWNGLSRLPLLKSLLMFTLPGCFVAISACCSAAA